MYSNCRYLSAKIKLYQAIKISNCKQSLISRYPGITDSNFTLENSAICKIKSLKIRMGKFRCTTLHTAVIMSCGIITVEFRGSY